MLLLFSRVSLEMTASFKVRAEKKNAVKKGKRFKCDYNSMFVIY